MKLRYQGISNEDIKGYQIYMEVILWILRLMTTDLDLVTETITD